MNTSNASFALSPADVAAFDRDRYLGPFPSFSPDDMGPTVHFVMVTQIHNGLVELDENFVVQPGRQRHWMVPSPSVE